MKAKLKKIEQAIKAIKPDAWFINPVMLINPNDKDIEHARAELINKHGVKLQGYKFPTILIVESAGTGTK